MLSSTPVTLPSELSTRSTPVERSSSTLCSAWRPPHSSPISRPRPRSIGTSAYSTMVTSCPRPDAVAATSAPMKPAPTTTTFLGSPPRSLRSAAASTWVRSTCTPAIPAVPGSRRGEAPLAITIASTVSEVPSSSVTDLAGTSSESARVLWCHTASSSAILSSGRSAIRSASHSPARYCFDRGGRSYGISVSPLTIVSLPSKPDLRSWVAHRTPASDPPMMATDWGSPTISCLRF